MNIVKAASGASVSAQLEQRLRTGLALLDANGLRRSLNPPSGIDLSSNDYLCLSMHPHVRQGMAEAILLESCGSTGSRLLRGERHCFSRLEQKFAAFKGSDRALYFSSGYLANIAVLSTIPEAGDIIYSDERNHASLIDGIRLSRAARCIFPHNNVAALARLLSEDKSPGQKFVVTESLFSMDGDFAPLAEYADLCQSSGAVLIVDEAHAVGVCGARGSGRLEETGAHCFVSVNTGGKALGVAGAFVAGPELAIEYLIQRARPFIFSTAAPPPVAVALETSLEIIESEPWRREQLRSRSAHLRRRLKEARIVLPEGRSQIVPLVVGENELTLQIARYLQHEGFDVRAIRPPTVPPGTARLRISVNCGLSEETIDRFALVLSAAMEKAGRCDAVCL